VRLLGGFWLLLATAMATLGGCSRGVEEVETREAMDTQVTVRVVAANEKMAKAALAAAWAEMDICAAKLNRYDPKSDIARINADAGKFHTSVLPLTATCLGAARGLSTATGGAFDPTVGPLVDLWRRAAKEDRLPTDDELAKARSLIGMDKVDIIMAQMQPGMMAQAEPSEEEEKAEEKAEEQGKPGLGPMMMHAVGIPQGMSLDLGAIAKGYIAGRMANRMAQAGAIAGLVAAAGDICGFGERPRNLVKIGGDRRWSVAVQDPRYPEDRSRFYTAIHVENKGVCTSGHYYRGYTIQGKRYSHILDPRTGRPVDNRLASVTVVAFDPATADALATALVVMGVEKGMELVAKLEGVECLMLEAKLKEGQEFQASGAPPPEAELIAHRSRGFAALEFKPESAEAAAK
jgi:thiamine biosynthesis lipoprotein